MFFRLVIFKLNYTAISRTFVGQNARNNPERYCGAFEVTVLQRNLKVVQEAKDVCLRVFKESKKSRLDSYSVRNSTVIISHITFRDYLVQIFSDNLSRNS